MKSVKTSSMTPVRRSAHKSSTVYLRLSSSLFILLITAMISININSGETEQKKDPETGINLTLEMLETQEMSQNFKVGDEAFILSSIGPRSTSPPRNSQPEVSLSCSKVHLIHHKSTGTTMNRSPNKRGRLLTFACGNVCSQFYQARGRFERSNSKRHVCLIHVSPSDSEVLPTQTSPRSPRENANEANSLKHGRL